MAQASSTKKPNILVIWGDDIGHDNVSAYHRGLMGGRTPNIDRIATGGAMFTDCYGQQSCTAGRASFIMGQNPFRTGLLTIGLPQLKQGIRAQDPTIAELLKPHGYMTFQVGKNHLGDRNECLPTVHGFDEFYGNLYHLNSEEEPENVDYPKDPAFRENFGPRGVLDSAATTVDDPTEQPRWGRVGKQTIKDTGPLTSKRMETIEDDLLARSLDHIEKAHKAGKPFFLLAQLDPQPRLDSPRRQVEEQNRVWRVCRRDGGTRLRHRQAARQTRRVGHRRRHDRHVFHGQRRRDLQLASGWLSCVPRREGPYQRRRFPCAPGRPLAGRHQAWHDHQRYLLSRGWLPTLLAAVGDPDVKEKLLKGMKFGDKTFKAHIDGYNQMDLLSGKGPGQRKEILYFDGDGNMNALRHGDWKIIFTEMSGNLPTAWHKTPSWPLIVNLRQDPYERYMDQLQFYTKWYADRMFMMVPAQTIIATYLESLKEFPPVMGSSLSISKVLEASMQGPSKVAGPGQG